MTTNKHCTAANLRLMTEGMFTHFPQRLSLLHECNHLVFGLLSRQVLLLCNHALEASSAAAQQHGPQLILVRSGQRLPHRHKSAYSPQILSHKSLFIVFLLILYFWSYHNSLYSLGPSIVRTALKDSIYLSRGSIAACIYVLMKCVCIYSCLK